jgi:hypothetical protein
VFPDHNRGRPKALVGALQLLAAYNSRGGIGVTFEVWDILAKTNRGYGTYRATHREQIAKRDAAYRAANR